MYRCNHCNTPFSSEYELRRHLDNMHGSHDAGDDTSSGDDTYSSLLNAIAAETAIDTSFSDSSCNTDTSTGSCNTDTSSDFSGFSGGDSGGGGASSDF